MSLCCKFDKGQGRAKRYSRQLDFEEVGMSDIILDSSRRRCEESIEGDGYR